MIINIEQLIRNYYEKFNKKTAIECRLLENNISSMGKHITIFPPWPVVRLQLKISIQTNSYQ